MRRHPGPNRGRTLTALLNTLLAFATGLLVWLLIFLIFSDALDTPPPFMPVVVFALLMGGISFVLEVDTVLAVFSRLWRWIGKIFSRLI